MTNVVVDLAVERGRRRGAREAWVSQKELSAHLGVTARTIRNWQTGGQYTRGGGKRIPFQRLFGSSVRFIVSDVEAWLRLPADSGFTTGDR
jgi:predicted DNA-binding transcriptional regulator AlpA